MKAFVTFGVVLAVIFALVGCGGAGTPGADSLVAPEATVSPAGVVGPLALDTRLVRTWMLVKGTSDGVVVAPSNITGWPTGATRDVVALASNGTCVETYYNNAGGVVNTDNGTWTASGGTGSLNWGEGAIAFTYSFPTPNVLNLAFTSGDGHAKTSSWAKLATLTGHDPALVKTWKATSVQLNGVSKPLTYLSGSTVYTRFARQFLAGGASQRYLLKPTMQFQVPMMALQTWVSGNGVLNYGGNPRQASLYSLAGDVLTIWQLDYAGNTLKITLTPFGRVGGHDVRWLGQWHPVSATSNGVAAPVADVLGYFPDQTWARMTYFADGTLDNRGGEAPGVLGGGILYQWSTSGSALTLVQLGPGGWTHNVNFSFASGTVVTWSWNPYGTPLTVTWNKGP